MFFCYFEYLFWLLVSLSAAPNTWRQPMETAGKISQLHWCTYVYRLYQIIAGFLVVEGTQIVHANKHKVHKVEVGKMHRVVSQFWNQLSFDFIVFEPKLPEPKATENHPNGEGLAFDIYYGIWRLMEAISTAWCPQGMLLWQCTEAHGPSAIRVPLTIQ